MKIHCDTCGAKYSIADDKVEGKVFKIRCKKCDDVIVVKGEQEEQTREMSNTEDAHGATDEASEWYAVIDGDQVGPVTAREIEDYIEEGVLQGDSYVWREGLGDWEPLNDLDMFADAVGGGAGDDMSAAPDEATVVADNPLGDDGDDFDIESAASAQPQEPEAEETVVADPGDFGSDLGGEGGDATLQAAEGGSLDAEDELRDDLAAEAQPETTGMDEAGGFDDSAGAGDPAPPSGSHGSVESGSHGTAESGSQNVVDSGSHETTGRSDSRQNSTISGSHDTADPEPDLADKGGQPTGGDDGFSGSSSTADVAVDGGGASFESFSGESGTGSATSSGASTSGSGTGGGGGGEVSANDMVEQRNENSVLFSLDSVDDDMASGPSNESSTGGGGDFGSNGGNGPSMPTGGDTGGGEAEGDKPEGSGLIDIQSLASTHAAMKSEGDDGGGGDAPSPGGGSESASQDVSPQPATNNVPNLSPSGSRRNSRWLVVAVVIGALAVFMVAGVVVYLFFFQEPQKPKRIVENTSAAAAGEKGNGESNKKDESGAAAEDDGKGSEETKKQAAAGEESDSEDEKKDSKKESGGESDDEAKQAAKDENAKDEQKQDDSATDDSDDERRRVARNDRGGSEPDSEPSAGAAAQTGGGRDEPEPTNRGGGGGGGDDDIDNLLNQVGSKKESGSASSGGGGGGGSRQKNLPKTPTRSMVKNTIGKYQGRVDRCARDTNRNDLSGSMFVKFRIQPSGEVNTASVRSSKFKGTDVGKCVQRVVESMSFPQTKQGMPVKFPFSIK